MPSVIGAIRDKWNSLGGPASFLGDPTTDELATPDGVGRFNRFRGGMIYWTPSTGAQEVHGAILEKWESLGFERSFLGYPVTDEMDFTEGGRISVFQHGAIYWWPDTGPIELNNNQVIIHYTGLNCFNTTSGPGDDEPYVVLGVITPVGNMAIRTRIYDGVDDGNSVPDLIELYRGEPRGIAISVLLMENDEDDPDKYKAAMQAAASAAASGLTLLIGIIPVVGPILSPIAGPILSAIAPGIGSELNKVLGTGDDRIGQVNVAIPAKQMVVLAARTNNSVEKSIGFKLVTPPLTEDGGFYKVYFGLVPT